jgi:glyoxylase-like metal-dependent hydrolase (beta-lactamase superfamily II)
MVDWMQFDPTLARHLAAGEYVFHCGEPGRHMYVVRRGSIDILDPAGAGAPALIRQVQAGDIFGEIALIESVPRTADARAGPDGAELMQIDQAHFVYLAVQQPAFGILMMRMLSRKLRGAPPAHHSAEAAVLRKAGAGDRTSRWLQLDEGVYQLGGQPGSGGCKVYLVRGNRRNVLIDAGLPSDSPHIVRHLEALGLAAEDIDMVLLTHEHMDHIGGTARFSPRTLVAAHSRAARKIARGDDLVQMSAMFGLEPACFHVDLELEEGAVIDIGGTTLRALHTPGHVSGAVCYYDAERELLFTADTLFAGGILGGIFASGSNSDYLGSLRRLHSLRIRAFFPGHGRNSDTPHEDIERGILASERLASETRALFETMRHNGSFDYIMRGTAAYAASHSRPAG